MDGGHSKLTNFQREQAQQSLMEEQRASNMANFSESEQIMARNQQFMSSAKPSREVLSKLADAKIIGDFHRYSQRNLHKE